MFSHVGIETYFQRIVSKTNRKSTKQFEKDHSQTALYQECIFKDMECLRAWRFWEKYEFRSCKWVVSSDYLTVSEFQHVFLIACIFSALAILRIIKHPITYSITNQYTYPSFSVQWTVRYSEISVGNKYDNLVVVVVWGVSERYKKIEKYSVKIKTLFWGNNTVALAFLFAVIKLIIWKMDLINDLSSKIIIDTKCLQN